MNITELIPIPLNINHGLTAVNQKTMIEKFGHPRDFYTNECLPVTNNNILKNIITANVGPFKVTGFNYAISSLITIMKVIQNNEPEIYKSLGTAGMLCARLVRGSKVNISNHSWGTAIDLTINGKLDIRKDNRVQIGLAKIAPIFNAYGWYWGAGFRNEDAMHFELSNEKIQQYIKSNKEI